MLAYTYIEKGKFALVESYWPIRFLIVAGTPATKQFSGTSLVTTLPAAITQPAPIVTPCITETFAPNQQLSPTLIGNALSNPLFLSA